MQKSSASYPEPIPAAAVAFVRDTHSGIEIYLSRRPSHFRYYPDAFVFPGGRADHQDDDLLATACREVKEEIGIEIQTSELVPLRDIHTSSHAGPVYRMLTFAYRVEGEFPTMINKEEVAEEVWLPAKKALTHLYLPYQVKAAIYTISSFPTTPELFRALRKGCINEDYWF